MKPLIIASQLGYYTVGMQIDPGDWQKPGVDAIVAATIDQVHSSGGNIVLLHDGGGDRTETVIALPKIIAGLRKAGFQFVSVSDLLGKTRAEVMPALTPVEQMRAQADSFIFTLLHEFRLGMVWVFLVGIALVTGRVVIVGVLALVEKQLKIQAENHFNKGVSLFVEEKLAAAITEWEKALELDPQHPQARPAIEKARKLLQKVQEIK